MCCRVPWRISISLEEYRTSLYIAEQICRLTNKICDKQVATCINRNYQLKKNADGACMHLDENSQCKIYKNRPKVCRDFVCQGGWRLNSVFPAGTDDQTPVVKLEKKAFLGRLTDDMTFVSHPLIKLHAVCNVKLRGEIVFIKEMVGTCGKFNTRDSFQCRQLDDDLLLRLIREFDSKDTLQKIRQRFCDQRAVSLTKEEFDEIVWLLNKHSIVLEARNFSGMLAGMGGI